MSQQAGKTSKVTLERTLEAASREQKSRQRLMTLDEKITLHKHSNSSVNNRSMAASFKTPGKQTSERSGGI